MAPNIIIIIVVLTIVITIISILCIQLYKEKKQKQLIEEMQKRLAFLKRTYPNAIEKAGLKNITIDKNNYHHNYYKRILNDNLYWATIEQNIKQKKEEEGTRIEKQVQVAIERINNVTTASGIPTAKSASEVIAGFITNSEGRTKTDLLQEAEKALKSFDQRYEKGLLDNTERCFVEYDPISQLIQGEDWHYSVVKFPKRGCPVFPYRRKKIALRGVTESSFQNALAKAFHGENIEILGDAALHLSDGNRPYEPDIAIIDKNKPYIRIDVEIDEPYTYTFHPDKRPKAIHHIQCNDNLRDEYVTHAGWIVIRFAEEQIIYETQKCIDMIAYILCTLDNSLTLGNKSLVQPSLVSRWTETEALVMASQKKREKYLGQELKEREIKELKAGEQTEEEKQISQQLDKPTFNSYRQKEVNSTRDKDITFLPKEHIYLYKDGSELTPVSSVISHFFSEFDKIKWSEIKAQQRGIPQGQQLEEWDAKGAEAREAGTYLHLQIEKYYNRVPYNLNYMFKYSGCYVKDNKIISLQKEWNQFLQFTQEHNFQSYSNEWAIFDELLGIAGTIDFVHFKGGDSVDIYDWKRSKKILDQNNLPIKKIEPFGKQGINGLENVPDTTYFHYCLQQNLYKYILERKYNKKVEHMYLVVFDKDKSSSVKIEAPVMTEAIKIITNTIRNNQ